MPSTRRDFLKHTSAAALSAGLLTRLNAGAYAQGDDTIRIGLIGAGGRGSQAAVQALSTKGNIKLTAIGDAFPDQLESSLSGLRNEFSSNPEKIAVEAEQMFSGMDAYRKVIDSDVDVVLLATPPGFRPTHFEYAVEKGKHVFMEKPVAVDAPGVRQVLAAAEKAKEKQLKVGVGLQRRHQNCYLDIVPRVHDGEAGEIVALRVYWNSGGVWEPGSGGYHKSREQCSGEMEYQLRNWYYYNWLCGDHICEQHIHNIDVGLWLKNALPVRARGVGGREVRTDKKYGEIFDHHTVEYFFEDGSVMFSECTHTRNTWSDVSEHAYGTKAAIHLQNDDSPRTNRIEPYGGEAYAFRGRGSNPYQVEHDELFAAIREGRTYSEAERGATSTMAAVLGRMCTYSGKEIGWDEALNNGLRATPEDMAGLTLESMPPTMPNENGEYPVPVPGVTAVLG